MEYGIYLQIASKVLLLLVIVLAIALLVSIIRKVSGFIYQLRRPLKALELTPPVRSDRTPEATSQLLLSLFSLLSNRSIAERLMEQNDSVSLEITSSRGGGIRYLILCHVRHAQTIEHMVASYLPDIRVRFDNEYTGKAREKSSKVFEFSQKSHFAYPLRQFEYLDNHDPIAYITNSMTKLSDGETITYQLILEPYRSSQAERLNKQLMTNADLRPMLSRRSRFSLGKLGSALSGLLFGIGDAFASILRTYDHNFNYETQYVRGRELEHKKNVARGIKPVRQLTYFEQGLTDSMHQKLQQPLFLTDIRISVAVESKKDLTLRRNNIQAALGLYATPEYQQLVLRSAKHYLMQRYTKWSFIRRIPSLLEKHRNVLSASELSSLFHFPHTRMAKTENVVKSLSKALPAPISLKGGQALDILIGENHYQGTTTPIGLTEAERERHIYVIGGTGNGKTTMLLYGIVQDIKNGKGITVVDPHGDLAEKILRYIPESRIKDVIYMNPDDLAYPIGMNLLELTPGLTGDDLLREKDVITEATISVLRKIFSDDDSGGHRIEYILRNAIQTALTLDEPTLFTIFRLLNDAKFRRSVVKTLEDKNLIDFWKNELGKAGEFQRVKMAAGITAKIGRFLFSASARQVLEQPKSTINFEDILASKKILICNFSKGLLGEDTSTLFGTTVLAKIQTAALRRARLKTADREPYYLYVDEFQNFATMSFVQMLSEARKYKLFLTMAEQSTSQQDQQRLVDIILANVGTVICFRSGSPADERLVLPLFSPFIEPGEIANLPSFTFYARIAAVHSQEPMSGMTVLLDGEGSEKTAQSVIQNSREQYTRKRTIPHELEIKNQSTKKQTVKNKGERLTAKPVT